MWLTALVTAIVTVTLLVLIVACLASYRDKGHH